ncbi:septum formation protein Maf [bacterium]|nr:septum formation protein Maf [bacterium]
MKKIILASTSPRRKQLLKDMGIDFKIIAPEYDEKITDKHFSDEIIKNIAVNKAKSVLYKVKEPSLIIGSDTVVIINGIITGKPKDKNDAFNILKSLSGIKHSVVTSIAIIDSETGKIFCENTRSEIEFNPLSDEDIKNYIENFKPFDKAGAYGIQELPTNFVKEITGDFDNIVGFPTKTLKKMLSDM